MTNAIITISSTWCSALGAFLLGWIFFYKSQLESNSAKLLDELFNKKEAKLDEGKRLLLQEQNRQQKASDKLGCRAKDLEENETKLKDDARLLEAKFAQQKKLEDDLRGRINDIEKREEKLIEDVKSLEERIKEQDRVKVDIEGRLNEVEMKEKKLKADLNSFQKERAGQKSQEERLSIQLIKDIDELKTKVKEGHALVEEEQNKRTKLEEDFKNRTMELEERKVEVSTSNSRDDEEEEESTTTTSTSVSTILSISTRSNSITSTVVDEEDCTNSDEHYHLQDETIKENGVDPGIIEKVAPPSNCDEPSENENETRVRMIEAELNDLIKLADENELEEPFDEDSIEALKKGALKMCYVKKYYNVMKDEFIYFPSVPQTVIDYRLFEEAEQFYFDDEDEFPQDLSIGLRSVATDKLILSQDDDYDEEYMTALAQDIEI